jgi:predicted MFS family arabinose efflux permease
VIPHVATARVRLRDFDLLGAFSSTAALFALVYAVVEAPDRGWASPVTIGLLALCLLLCAAFVVIERRHPRPLVRLGILRSRALVHANIAAAAMFGGYAAFQFVVTLYLQDSLGWSPLGMALAFLPSGVVVAITSSRMEAVLERVETARLIFCGLLAFIAAYALFLRAEPSMPYAEFMLPTMLLIGAGFGLCAPAVIAQAARGVADHEQGLASGVLNTSAQIGGAIVVAVVGAILNGSGTSDVHRRQLPGMTAAIAVPVGVTLFALALTVRRLMSAERGATRARLRRPRDN